MPLYAKQFFTEQLRLTDGTVIGDSYYSAPTPGSPLRLRIDFARTIRVGEYDGLRLQILHTEQGVLDSLILTFAAHGTLRSRDDALDRHPGDDGYAVIRDWSERDEPPWQGAATTKLRQAIEQYTALWFPQTAKQQLKQSHDALSPARRPATEAPNGLWLTDPDFRTRLHGATVRVLDVLADCLDDDFRLIQALDGARHQADELLGVPQAFGALAEAQAAAQIVGGDIGSPFDPAIARALVLLDQRPVEEQEQAVRTALRRLTLTTRSHAPTAPRPPAPLPPSTGRTR
ncbi:MULTISPECIES: hypothetical protein [Streptomyces]|uniref:Uncharacterized protein n=1 Tax=Streptomyces eurythermus TaxID=42237 RepID=A0ABW6Z5S0_9ACTN|nr:MULTISPECIES: hypothetical protein [Streptomyces]QIS75051.1 hypothetical protein HB370_38020 [Streptomyces sp. DSM 40868]